jgi:hypothetical protein
MTNLQLFLAIGIPSILVILSWLSNRQDFRDVSTKVDRHYETLNGKIDRLGETLNGKIDRQTESFNNQVTTLLTTIHNVDMRVVKLESEKE